MSLAPRTLVTRIAGNAFAIALLFAIPQAKANTYLFSVTGGEILNALASNGSDRGAFASSAFFSVFLRPSIGEPFSYVSETSPNPDSPTRAWEASTITDYANLGGPAAYYAKGEDQASVAVLSRARPGGKYMFLGYTYEDDAPWPVDWGGRGTINEILSENSLFQFMISTSATLSGPYTILGGASAIVSTSSRGVSDPKTKSNITFSLTGTPLLVVPEPATYLGSILGLTALVIARRLRGRRASN